MRFGVKVLLGLVILGVLGVGLLPPVFQESYLRTDANAAAQAGAHQLLAPSQGGSVDSSVAASVASHRGVTLASVRVSHGIVTVVLKKNIHTFLSGIPGMEPWFHLTVTESASEFG